MSVDLVMRGMYNLFIGFYLIRSINYLILQ